MVIRIVNLYISKIFSCTSSSPATNNDSTSSYIPEQHTYTTGDKKMLRKEAQWKLREATYNKEVRFDGKKRRYRNEKQMLLFITIRVFLAFLKTAECPKQLPKESYY